jgi:hypothetical protein
MEPIVIKMVCVHKEEWPDSQRVTFKPTFKYVIEEGTLRDTGTEMTLDIGRPDTFLGISVNDIVSVAIVLMDDASRDS